MRAVRTKRYKYVRNFGDLPEVHIPAPLFSSEAGNEVRTELSGSWRPQEELYDLPKGPNEQENVAQDPSYAEEVTSLRGTVDQWMQETEDRLSEGTWPPSDI